MHLVQERAAAHRDLSAQKFVIEERGDRKAEEKVLLDLSLKGPRHGLLMRDHVAASQRVHDSNSPELSMRRHRGAAGLIGRAADAGSSGIVGDFEGNQSSTTPASLGCPVLSNT